MIPCPLETALESGIRSGTARLNPDTGTWEIRGLELGREVLRSRIFDLVTLESDPLASVTDLSPGVRTMVQRGLDVYAQWFNVDPERHRRIRPVMAAPFSPQPVADLEAWIEAKARVHLAVTEACPSNAARAFASDFPRDIVFDLVGILPSLRPDIAKLVDPLLGFVTDTEESVLRAALAQAMLAARLERIFDRPAPPEATLRRALEDAVRDARMSRAEAIATLSVLLLAGGMTSVALSGLLALLEGDRDLVRQIDSGEIRWADVIEEALRWMRLPADRQRVALQDIHLDGQTILTGSRLVLDINAMNVDPDTFASPEKFDPRRRDGEHVSFGAGLHRCIGRHLARSILRIGAIAFLEMRAAAQSQ